MAHVRRFQSLYYIKYLCFGGGGGGGQLSSLSGSYGLLFIFGFHQICTLAGSVCAKRVVYGNCMVWLWWKREDFVALEL